MNKNSSIYILITARNYPLYNSIEECKHVYFLKSTQKYSYGPSFIPKAGGGGGGSRFAWKVQLWTSFRTESRGSWGWISLRAESTIMDLVSYRKQGVVPVDLASRGKYS